MPAPIYSWNTAKTHLFAAALLFAAACEANPPAGASQLATESEETTGYAPGVPGGVKQRVSRLTATVTAIDYATRRVTLKDDAGNEETLVAPAEAINFDQVKQGDRVTVIFAEELVVYLKDKNAPTTTDNLAVMAARAPAGSKPNAMAANTVEITAVVTAIDLANHAATLKLQDGESRTVKVREDVVLSEDQVGREVVLRSTEAVLVSVEKSQ